MARIVLASLNIADTVTSVQLQTAQRPRVRSAVFKARTGNTGSVFISSDSAAKSAGFEMAAGDREEFTVFPATVKGTSFWVWGATVGDRIDYSLLLEE